jgi:thioester reductase-like protein
MASHSGLLAPFLAPFTDVVAGYRRSAPEIPYCSCATGTWITAGEATDPAYWARQLREPVQFSRIAATLREQPSRILLEVGPGQTLTTLIGAQGVQPSQAAVPSMRRADMAISDRAAALTAAGRLWQLGVELDWEHLRGGQPAHRIALPTYAFERKRHWIDAGYPTGPGLASRLPHAPRAGAPAEAAHARPEAPAARSREAVVARVWREVLGVAEIGLDDDFASIGGHSLLAAQVAMQLRAELACEIAAVDVYLAPTIRQLAALLDERHATPGAGPARTSLADDVRLDPAIAVDPAQPQPRRPAAAVLLTGATGYLGAYLLAELLRATEAQVYCLVRAGDAPEAALRLRKKLASLELANLPWHRVIAIPGDLERDGLGLSPPDRALVAAECDAIYHCGAWVNFSRPYRILQRANVHGTEQILALATTGRRKEVHFVSTIFVSAGAIARGATAVTEDDPLPPPEGHDTGYTESKWVAEGICRLAIERGIALAIHRPGNILADSRTGVCNLDDYVTRMILGCVELGAAPLRNYPLPIGMVDEVARSIVAISRTPDCFGRAHHVIARAPLHWNRIFDAVREAGYDVSSVPWTEWCRRLTESTRAGAHNALAPLVDLLNTAAGDRPMPAFTAERAHAAGAACELPSAMHLSRMLQYLTRSGRLPAMTPAGGSVRRLRAGDGAAP